MCPPEDTGFRARRGPVFQCPGKPRNRTPGGLQAVRLPEWAAREVPGQKAVPADTGKAGLAPGRFLRKDQTPPEDVPLSRYSPSKNWSKEETP